MTIKSKKVKVKKQILELDDKVKIAIKPYKGKTEIGIVNKVLTKKKYHSRGHKVMLESGTVGRIIKIIKRKCKNCGKHY